MKRKIVTAIIAGMLVVGSAVPAYATPTTSSQVNQVRDEYAELGEKISDIQNKISDLNVKIEPLVQKVQENKKEISNTKKEIETTQKEIDQTKEKMKKQEEVLNGRLRELYKSGGQTGYLSLIFGADSFSDLISRLDSANRLVELDKSVASELLANKNSLDEKMTSLQTKNKKLEDLNNETQKELNNFKQLKSEQEKLAEQAKAAQKEFDAKYLSKAERQVISTQLDTINNSNSSSSDLKSAIQQLKDIRDNQIKSPTVVKEINDALDKGQKAVVKKEKEEKEARERREREQKEAARRERAQQAAQNRGGSVSHSSSNNSTSPSNNNSTHNNSASNSSSSNSSSHNNASNSSNNSSSSNNNASNSGSSNNSSSSNNGGTQQGSVQAVLNVAYAQLGKPYVWGATGPDTFDCSGFTSYAYSKATGIYIGRTTYDQIGAGVSVSRDNLKPGDLVFPHAGHVGIYVGNGNIIHAPRTGDVVKVSPIWSFYGARRILN